MNWAGRCGVTLILLAWLSCVGATRADDAVDQQIDRLKFGPGACRAAAEALGKLKDPRAVEPLLTLLKESESEVRKAAAVALGEIKDARAVEPLIAALKQRESDRPGKAAEDMKQIEERLLRHAAAGALGRIKDARAVGPLAAALRDGK